MIRVLALLATLAATCASQAQAATIVCYRDADGDGYGDPTNTRVEASTCSTGYVIDRTDCDDASVGINPAATEGVGDGVDTNCDGSEHCYDDDDGDGYLDTTGDTRLSADRDCADTREGSTSTPTTDCDDADAGDYPGAVETIANGDDEDCDTTEICYYDDDDDGHLDASGDTRASTDLDCNDALEGTATDARDDCDDADGDRYPGNTEIYGDEIDQDCDNREICFEDADDDGYVPDALPTRVSADQDCDDALEANASEPAGDCDDGTAAIKPGVAELAGDEVDQNCDAVEVCYDDDDDDGYLDSSGDTRSSTDLDCSDAFEGLSTDPTTDCDDTTLDVSPAATEIVGNELDEDCDRGETCFADADGDGARGTSTVRSSDLDCDDAGESDASSSTVGDCDDTNASIGPSATELPNDGVDQNCDGKELCTADADGDGYASASGATSLVTGTVCPTVSGANDCDDTNEDVNPGATEIAGDETDQNCDGLEVCFHDDDDDDFLDASADTVASTDLDCTDAEEGSVTTPTTDCDDTDADIRPTATERVGDEVDQDCDRRELCWYDTDNDGYLPDAYSVTIESTLDTDCRDYQEQGTPSASIAPDCDDADGTVYPGATELCDDVDQDCDGDDGDVVPQPRSGEACGSVAFPTALFVDADDDGYGDPDAAYCGCSLIDGYSLSSADCDDDDDGVRPGAPEVCNGRDDDCDASEDEGNDLDPSTSGCVDLFRDVDADGYGAESESACLCQGDSNAPVEYLGYDYVTWRGDCDDYDADTRPNSCADGIDNDDDGEADGDDTECSLGLIEGGGAAPNDWSDPVDGADNDCDGYIAAIELDCDDDGEFARLPSGSDAAEAPAPTLAADVGLSPCIPGLSDQRTLECWGETLDLECRTGRPEIRRPSSGFWMLRYDNSDDAWGGRFEGGRRVSLDGTCSGWSDCDDQCASRCATALEVCDGIDNDCVDADVDDDNGLPTSQVGVVAGTISVTEGDRDDDGYTACEAFRADADQELRVLTDACPEGPIASENASDCNDLCALTYPDAEEVCDGFDNTCSGSGEGADGDDDSYATCGAWAAADAAVTEEHVYVVVWTDDRLSGDTADTASEDSFVPLIPPRYVPATREDVTPTVAVCDAPLYDALADLVGDYVVDRSMTGDPAALAEACVEQADRAPCALVRLRLSADSDELTEPGKGSFGLDDEACLDRPEQYVTRTVWSRERIVAARRVAVELSCLRLYGTRCAAVSASTTYDRDASLHAAQVDVDALAEQWPLELGRYELEQVTNDRVGECWGSRDSWLEFDAGIEVHGIGDVGGDCADGGVGDNRDAPEGPADLVAVWTGATIDCEACLDGVDNNCDGQADCEDPSCAPCFVGQGLGCPSSDASPCATSACAAGATAPGAAGVLTLGILAVAATRLRRGGRADQGAT